MSDYIDLSIEKSGHKNIYEGEVVNIDDKYETRTIKVRIFDFDKKIKNIDLPDCYPLLPAFFHFVPNIGERVLVFLDRVYKGDNTVNQEKRYYINTSISSPKNIKNDPLYYSASSNESDGWLQQSRPISELPDANGTYLRKDELGLAGRENTDVILRNKEVIIRAGKHEANNPLKFNKKDPSFIQLKYGLENTSKEIKTKIVTEKQNIAPTHAISVTTDDKHRLLIKVIRQEDNLLSDKFSKSYSNRKDLISSARNEIRVFQSKYQRWTLSTSESELGDLSIIFPNNTKVVKKEVQITDENEFKEFGGSVINFVADKFNFISHLNNGGFNVTDQDKQITSDEQLKINSIAHPSVYGDKLLEFLNLVKIFVANHSHPYHGMSPVQDDVTKKVLNYNLDEIMNQHFRFG